MARIGLLSLGVLFTLVVGCSGDASIGHLCLVDEDCGFGLQCFKPAEGIDPVCTVGCADDPCESGMCITSEFGDVCTSVCERPGECPGDLVCQSTPSGEKVCWYEDEHLEALPSGLRVDNAKLVSDTNNDGALNPGETAVLQFYPTNASSGAIDGVWAELVATDATVSVSNCKQPAYPTWLPCSAACSCEMLGSETRLSVDGLSTSTLPVMEVAIVLAETAPIGIANFKIRLYSASGESWDSVITVPVLEQQGAIVVHEATIVSEENGDGLLSPGEEVVVAVTVANYGSTQVQGLYAALAASPETVEVISCAAPVGSNSVPCNLKCSCEDASEATKQTLEPSEIGSSPLFSIRFRISEAAEPGPIPFGLSLVDSLGNSWSSAFSMDLAPDEAKIVLAQTEILEDANGDGYLSPAEQASIQVFARNAGASKALDVWAELIMADDNVEVMSCSVGVGDGWTLCDKDCSCENATAAGKQQLEPGETSTIAALVIAFEVHPGAPFVPLIFQIAFHDALGNSWVESFEIEVFSPNADLEVASVSLLDDANADGFLSPAEDATVEMYARNVGTSRALAVYAAVSDYSDSIEIYNCYSQNQTQWELCNVNCSCVDTPDGAKQTIEAFSTGDKSILQVNFNLHSEAVLEPVFFQVTFYDAFGNSWLDTFMIDVVAVKADIQVADVQLWGDSNGDGILTPGESAKVQVYVKNSGVAKTFGVFAQLTQTDSHVDVSSCYAQTGDTWAKCDSACNCAEVPEVATQVLEAGEFGGEAILRANFDLSANAPAEPITFDITFRDLFGNEWERSFILDVEPYAADLGVGFTEVLDDTNEDGQLSPGESATAIIYPRNFGTVKALGVWAQLVSIEPGVSVSNCYAGAAGDVDAWAKCDSSCSCAGLFNAALQELEPETTSQLPILKMDFSLDPEVELGTVTFGIGLVDNLGLMWTDIVSLDVLEADTDIGIELYQVQTDTSDDGVLSPGESMTLDVYAANTGSAKAMGVWAKVGAPGPNVTLTGCYAKSEANTVSCALEPEGGCSCQALPSNMKVDLEGNSVSDDYILRFSFNLSDDAPIGLPVSFQLDFFDSFGNVDSDAFALDVVPLVVDESSPP
jgi:hypothetical protein